MPHSHMQVAPATDELNQDHVTAERSQTLPSGFERRSADVNGIRLSDVIGGQGDPVVLLHGWPETSRSWHGVMAPLADDGFTIIAPDLRGLGRSEHAKEGYSKDNQAEDLRQLLTHLDIGPEVRLVGRDIGGMIAFSFARLHPEAVVRLALVDLAIPGLGLEEAMDVANGGRFHFGFFMTPELPEPLFEGHERAFFSWWFRRLGTDPVVDSEEAIDEVTANYSGYPALRSGFEHYRTLLDDGRVNRAWRDAGGRLAMPVLAIGGERSAGARLAKSLEPVASDLEGVVIDGSGHFLPEERSDRLVALLGDFLGSGSA